jgi:hypothetical protein
LGFILGTDEINYTEKMFIEECPECNSWGVQYVR